MAISTIDVSAPFDPTAYTALTGAQLLQLVSGIVPYTDKGNVILSTDAGGVPEVPNATTTTKWKRCLWIRVSASSVGVYVWNPSAADDVTLLKWQSINIAGIGAGSIDTTMLKNLAVTDAKISSLDASKLTGTLSAAASAGLMESGDAAGGDLTGTYPNPAIAASAVTTAKIADNQVTHNKLGPKAVEPATDIKGNGTAKDMIRVAADTTLMEFFTPAKLVAASAGVVSTVTGTVPQVETGGAADTGTWVMVAPTTLGRVLQIVEAKSKAAAATTTETLALTAIPTTSDVVAIAALDAAITPLNAGSTLMVELLLHLSHNGDGTVIAALFLDVGANAVAAASARIDEAAVPVPVIVRYTVASGSLTARTFKAGFTAVTTHAHLNSTDGATVMFGGTLGVFSYLRVTEYI